MFEKFLSNGSRDFAQRYQGTYGFFRNNGKKQLTKLVEIGSNVRFVDKDDVVYTLNADSESDIGFEFLPPKAGWHNTPGGAFLVKRVPQRQWKRGICDANTYIGTPAGHRERVGFRILSQIYEKDTSVKAAIAIAEKSSNTQHVAVSEQFAYNKPKGSLYCLDTPIGKIEQKGEAYTVKLDNPDFWRTEVKDAFTRANLEVTIS